MVWIWSYIHFNPDLNKRIHLFFRFSCRPLCYATEQLKSHSRGYISPNCANVIPFSTIPPQSFSFDCIRGHGLKGVDGETEMEQYGNVSHWI